MMLTELERAKLFVANYFDLCRRYGLYIEREYRDEPFGFGEYGDHWWEQHKKDVRAAVAEIVRLEKKRQYQREYRKRKKAERGG